MAQKISILNDMFTDTHTESEILENYIYLTNKNRGSHTTEKAILKAYKNRKFANLLKKYDPIAFNQLN